MAEVPSVLIIKETEDCATALKRYFVQEWKILDALVSSMVQSNGHVPISTVRNAQRIMEKYQEQGQLLEPYLESMVCPLMQILCNQRDVDQRSMDALKKICSVIQTLASVCGYKTVVKFFPNQASHLELALSLLKICHEEVQETSSLREESTGQWETKYTLLLWLSILVLIPFDMASLDSSLTEADQCESQTPPLVEAMMKICKEYLSSPGPTRDMACVLLSRLLTRPDTTLALKSFVQWAIDGLSSATEDSVGVFLVPGIVGALAAIFKVGGRDILLQVADTIWKKTLELWTSSRASRNPLLRKLLIKLIHCIGLAHLPPRTPKWRYTGLRSSIKQNLSMEGSNIMTMKNGSLLQEQAVLEDVEDDDIIVPEVIEEIIEQLLIGLKDKDTIVRWSAAKGIGRVTGRLTSGFADDVVSSVLELFSPTEGDGAWHGGCLALAELARRGLLLPDRLSIVVPVVIQALHYDVRCGPHSVGSHVRDAAAYVCWAFARAYSPELMKVPLKQLVPALLTVACYDREVNCRRAASAAFQENVGRQGDYPHGIDLVNVADYFSLATRSGSYRNVAVFVAQFEEYRMPLVDELVNAKICHWDRGLRELAAEGLALLAKYDTTYFSGPLLDKLLPVTLSPDLNLRHGATIAIAEVILHLHQHGIKFSKDKETSLSGIVPAIEKARLYRGKGGEIMRLAVSRLIECTSLSQLPLSSKIQQGLLNTLNENLKHPNSQIQERAAAALNAFVRSYWLSANFEKHEQIILKYLNALGTDPNAAVRRGSALALGALPSDFLAPKWKDVLDTLCSACRPELKPDDQDAETRVNSVRSLVSICRTLYKAKASFPSSDDYRSLLYAMKEQVMGCLFDALDDYAVDNRGDVGSWVREAAMEAIESCISMLCDARSFFTEEMVKCKNSAAVPMVEAMGSFEPEEHDGPESLLFNKSLGIRVIGCLAKQAVEKIDRIREVAGRVLHHILQVEALPACYIPHKEKLQALMPEDQNFNWGVPADAFPRLIQILEFPEYRSFIMPGLVISVGGLAESLSKISLSTLLDFINSEGGKRGEAYAWIETELARILKTFANLDRVIVPTFKTIDILFSKGVFQNFQDAGYTFPAEEVLLSVKSELKKSKDVMKIVTGMNVLTHLALQEDTSGKEALSYLTNLLHHRYPKVRKICAEQLYLVLVQKDGENLENALELVSETCWDGPLQSTTDARDRLVELLNLQLFSYSNQGSRDTRSVSKASHDENASYAALVNASY